MYTVKFIIQVHVEVRMIIITQFYLTKKKNENYYNFSIKFRQNMRLITCNQILQMSQFKYEEIKINKETIFFFLF